MMKRIIAVIMTALLLTSCGGVGKTTTHETATMTEQGSSIE